MELDFLYDGLVILDGAMGTVLQQRGLPPGGKPELLNFTDPDLLRAGQARSMARAAMLDACGSAWVEAGCDEAEKEIAARFPGLHLTDRFSPGYGDLPLAMQKDICAVLDAPRRLGVQVTDSFLMNPSKSVTAVVGLSDRAQPARVRGCGCCILRENCQYRKEGKTCGS